MDEKELFLEKMKEMTGKSQDDIYKIYLESKMVKHSEIRALFINELGLTYGYANTLAHYITHTDGASLSEGKSINEVLDEIYSGEKSKFRSIHETIMKRIEGFGQFEVIPKKGYVSLKRKKQFAMIGPKTNSRMEIGINLKSSVEDQRLEEQPKGSMCQYIVKIKDMSEIDDQLFEWLFHAYQQSV
ncbi:MAG: DUF4287 domain-containing protein [Firmicutes bacterium]|nr:DUF4287 domain-containing protein [Bacillota bacterium]